jgi:5-deoxy-glucuronate isomerase
MSKVFDYPEFDKDGIKILTRTEGEYSDMLMDITVYQMKKGQNMSFKYENQEMALLLIKGSVKYSWEGNTVSAVRDDFINGGATCLHVCKGVSVEIAADDESEILLQCTENDKIFKSVLYTPENICEETFGQGEFEGKAQRTVRTFFDYSTAPYSNMVMGEIITPQGGWSSYPPHHHPQPEVYYYRFEKSQGFGTCFIGDDAFKIKDGSFCAIPGGKTHPQVTAPGYPMYYVWMIRHFDGNPWKDRIFDPDHEWLVKGN